LLESVTLFCDDEFADNGLSVLQSEVHGVGTFGEVGEIHDGFVAKVGVDENLLTEGIEDGHTVDVFGTFNVELTSSGVGVEVNIGRFGAIDAYESDDGNPAGVVAGESVVVECGLEGYINVALNVGDTECVGRRSLVSVSPFVSGTGSAGGIEHSSFASLDVPIAVDGSDDGGFLKGEHENHHAVAAKGISGEGIRRSRGGHGVVGTFVQIPKEAVASIDIGGVISRLVDGDIDMNGAVVAAVNSVVVEGGVEYAVFSEAAVC